MKVPLSRPYQSQEIEDAIIRVIRKGNFILGEECKGFEKELAEYFGVKHAILVGSGTSALYLSLRALNIDKNDEVLVPSHTAFPTGEGIMHPFVSATPRFVDIKEEGFTLDINGLEASYTDKVMAILPVHLYGAAADMDEIISFANERGLYVIEDACQAHGTLYKGKKVGSIADAAALSFYPSKNLGGYGDGGAVLTNIDDLAQSVRKFRNHGREGRYEHDAVSDNLRFDEINAASLRIQLKHLDESIDKRRRIASLYNEGLANSCLDLPKETNDFRHSYHLYVVMTQNKDKRDSLKQKLQDVGVGTEIHYPIPLHRQNGTVKYFAQNGFEIDLNLERTDQVVDRILSLPMYPSMTDDEVSYVIENVKNFQKFSIM